METEMTTTDKPLSDLWARLKENVAAAFKEANTLRIENEALRELVEGNAEREAADHERIRALERQLAEARKKHFAEMETLCDILAVDYGDDVANIFESFVLPNVQSLRADNARLRERLAALEECPWDDISVAIAWSNDRKSCDSVNDWMDKHRPRLNTPPEDAP